jgi:uncharacterized protein (TIGR02301 family)
VNLGLKILTYRIAALAILAITLAPSQATAQNLFDRLYAPEPQYEEPQYEEPRVRPRPRPKPRPKPRPAAAIAKPVLPGAATPAPGTPAANNAQPGTPAPSADDNPPPYEPQLLRLSEMLGALTYLQDLCGAQNGQIWRSKMSELMDAETQSQVRRARLAGAYNRGFNGYELSYRQCTPNAQAVITRFLDESGKIARDVGHRYGTS